jgi:hypothetical protein
MTTASGGSQISVRTCLIKRDHKVPILFVICWSFGWVKAFEEFRERFLFDRMDAVVVEPVSGLRRHGDSFSTTRLLSRLVNVKWFSIHCLIL